MAFFTGLLVFTEINTGVATQSAITLFKRNSSRAAKVENDKMSVVDEEMLNTSTSRVEKRSSSQPSEINAVTSPTRDVFSWRNLRYTVSMKDGEQRTLLNDISGFVAPGKLTALMGESGAGKVRIVVIVAMCPDQCVVIDDFVKHFSTAYFSRRDHRRSLRQWTPSTSRLPSPDVSQWLVLDSVMASLKLLLQQWILSTNRYTHEQLYCEGGLTLFC